MAKPKCLRDMLRDEMKDLQGPQVTKFRAELRRRLPEVVSEAAKAAKQPAEKPQGKEMLQNGTE